MRFGENPGENQLLQWPKCSQPIAQSVQPRALVPYTLVPGVSTADDATLHAYD